jgi:hypothetical protein
MQSINLGSCPNSKWGVSAYLKYATPEQAETCVVKPDGLNSIKDTLWNVSYCKKSRISTKRLILTFKRRFLSRTCYIATILISNLEIRCYIDSPTKTSTSSIFNGLILWRRKFLMLCLSKHWKRLER